MSTNKKANAQMTHIQLEKWFLSCLINTHQSHKAAVLDLFNTGSNRTAFTVDKNLKNTLKKNAVHGFDTPVTLK